jgi:hypothetical protein
MSEFLLSSLSPNPRISLMIERAIEDPAIPILTAPRQQSLYRGHTRKAGPCLPISMLPPSLIVH